MHLAPDQSRECSWSYLNHPAHRPATALLMGFLLRPAKCMSVSTSTGRWQGYRDAVSASSWFLQADSCFTLLALRQVCCLAGTLFHVACNTAAIARVQGTSRSFSFLPLPPVWLGLCFRLRAEGLSVPTPKQETIRDGLLKCLVWSHVRQLIVIDCTGPSNAIICPHKAQMCLRPDKPSRFPSVLVLGSRSLCDLVQAFP